MLLQTHAPALIAGVVSAVLYYLVLALGLGFIFLFLPTLPIFWLGFTNRPDTALQASIIGLVIAALLTTLTSSLLIYFISMALPSCYIAHEALKHGNAKDQVVWFPLTIIFGRLMGMVVFLLLAITLYCWMYYGSLQLLIAPYIVEAVQAFSQEMDEQASASLRDLAPHIAFLVAAISTWMWAGCLYLHAWAVNRELIRQKIATRPDMSIGISPPPNWTISLLIITAVASLFGSASLAFWGKASMIILLFPYFLLGISLIHKHSTSFEYRGLLLFFIYFLLAMQLWTALFIAAYALIYHLQLLNKYLSDGGSSSKS